MKKESDHMFASYPSCIYKEKTGYSAVFPDLGYLATDGKNLDDVLGNAVDCLARYIFLTEKEGSDMPAASRISEIDPIRVLEELGVSEDEVEESFVNLIGVDVTEYARKHFEKAVKKTLTIPAWLNKAALERNINFSRVLQEALQEKLFKAG